MVERINFTRSIQSINESYLCGIVPEFSYGDPRAFPRMLRLVRTLLDVLHHELKVDVPCYVAIDKDKYLHQCSLEDLMMNIVLANFMYLIKLNFVVKIKK